MDGDGLGFGIFGVDGEDMAVDEDQVGWRLGQHWTWRESGKQKQCCSGKTVPDHWSSQKTVCNDCIVRGVVRESGIVLRGTILANLYTMGRREGEI